MMFNFKVIIFKKANYTLNFQLELTSKNDTGRYRFVLNDITLYTMYNLFNWLIYLELIFRNLEASFNVTLRLLLLWKIKVINFFFKILFKATKFKRNLTLKLRFLHSFI